MSIEKRVYSSYAFTEDEREKSRINYDLYNQIRQKYKVFRHDRKLHLINGEDCDFEGFDIIIGRKAGYHHALYRIHKNSPNLGNDEIALLCDGGNLCFGYMMQGDLIRVSED